MKKILLLILAVLFVSFGYSQVGINTESPNRVTELDVHNLINGTDTIPKGIMIPRMSESKRNEIVIDAATSNSLMIYNTTEDCYNYYSKIEGEWRSLCGKLGKAQFDFDCSAILVLGNYVENQELVSSNSLKFLVTVTKPGTYDITGATSNGYFFSASGTFLTNGTYTIYAQGVGTPLLVQEDVVTISKNGEDANCSNKVRINVLSSIATYSINCSNIVVNGQYLKDTGLTLSNTIRVSVNVSRAGSYSITTPVTNGISFAASGNLAVGTQLITLIGTGIPTVNDNFPITINTNSPSGNTICSVDIPITLPPMTYAVIGQNVWSWAAAPRLRALSNTGMGTDVSFGPNGLVKIVTFSQLWSTSNVTTAANNLNNNAEKPDIVLYFAYDADPNSAITSALVTYINNGGCVIYGASSGASAAPVNTLMDGIFGMSTAQEQIAGYPQDDNTYPIANMPNDPIINGPFGNLSGRYWGEDNASTGSRVMTSLPPNSVQIATAYNPFGKPTVNPEYSIVWYNDTKNFVYFGDCTGAAYNNNTQDAYPASYSSSGVPQSKFYGNYPNPAGAPSQFVYNSALELNAVAWAIKKAAISGINPH